MIYKTTSYKTVIAKVNRDFALTGTSWVNPAIEWIGDGLDGIGHHCGLEKHSCVLEAYNHRVDLPCDLESILFVEYRGARLRVGGSKRFDLQNHVDNHTGDYFLENPDYLMTSFECGEITLHYQRYLVDEDGMPKVPDSNFHREALAFFILYKWLGRGNKHPTWDVKSALDMYKEYAHKARNKSKFPSIQQMDRFKNMWARVKFDHSLPDNFFGSAESTQHLFNV